MGCLLRYLLDEARLDFRGLYWKSPHCELPGTGLFAPGTCNTVTLLVRATDRCSIH